MKYYTIGEVFRQGLLKNHKGESYKHKASISKIFGKLSTKTKKTPWGEAKLIDDKTIQKLNYANRI
jgi:hypothetical protein